MTSQNHPYRGAFTLVELLVVITLIMILAGLAAAFLPAIGDSARQAQAATMLQQWILTAKQKALRDQVPAGLRLSLARDPTNNNKFFTYKDLSGMDIAYQVRQCQFIEQPDDFAVSPTSPVGALWGTAGQPYVFVNMPLTNQVHDGDYLEILGSGLMYRISGASPASSPSNSTQIHLSPRRPLTYTVNQTKQYRIVRAPRVTGDDLLLLPESVIIDLRTNDLRNPVPGNRRAIGAGADPEPIDILFSPSGALISPAVTSESINLWVREYDPNKPKPEEADPTDGGQTILAIYARSGLTAAHPPAPGRDPYAFIKDGRTSGK